MDEEIVYSVLNITKVTVTKFSSLYNLDHKETFDIIQSGILGQSDQLEKLGINMSQANLEAFALSQGINKSYSEMSEAEKTALRYNYMLEETSNVQGNFAKNSGSLTEQFKIAKLNMNDLSTEIGKILLPISESAMKKFNELGTALNDALKSEEVQGKIKNITDKIVELIEKVGDIALNALPKLIDILKWVIDNSDIISAGIVGIGTAMAVLDIGKKLGGIASNFQSLFLEIATGTPIMEALNIVFGLNPFALIAAAIIGLVAAFVYLWNTNEGFREAVTNCWNAIKEVGLGVWDWLVNFFTVDIPNAWNTLLEFFQGIPDWFVQLWDSVINTFISWGESIGAFFSETIPMWINGIIEWFNQLPYNIGFALGTVLGNIIQWVLDTWTYLVENIPLWIQGISDWFAQLPGVIGQWLINVLLNIYQWGSDVYNNAIEWISNTINSVVSWFAQLPGLIWGWLVNVVSGICQWGSEVYNNAIAWVSNTINSIINWFASLPANISTWLSNCISNIVNWGYNMVTSGANAAKDMVSSIIDVVSSLPGKIYDIGINIVEGLWNGILSMGGWIKDKVGGFFSGVVDGVKSVLGIHSPSRVFRDQVGKYMAQGVGVGFEDETKNVKSDMSRSLQDLVYEMQNTVDYEAGRISAMNSNRNGFSESTVTNNDNGITQNVTIVNPERTPSENARALKKVGRDLAFA